MLFFTDKNWGMRTAITAIAFGVIAFSVAGCQTTSPRTLYPTMSISDDIQIEEPAKASSLSSYLVGRHAMSNYDIDRAANNFATTLAGQPNNLRLMRLAFSTFYINGDVDNAALLASQIEQHGESVTFGSEPALILAIESRDYAGMNVLSDHLFADEPTRALGVIIGGWALILQDQGDAGLTRLLSLKHDDDAIAPFVLFSQSALMNEYLGRPADAVAAAQMVIDHPDVNVAVLMNMAGVMLRQGYVEEARDVLDNALSQIFDRTTIFKEIDAGTSPLMKRPTINHILAEAVVEASSIKSEVRISGSARLFLASRLAPDNDRVNYALGLHYQDLDQFDNALTYYDRIPAGSLWHHPTLFIKARFMSLEGQDQASAQKIFIQLQKTNPTSPAVWQQSGDAARRRGDYNAALSAYEHAITLNPEQARLYYSKAIILDKLDQKNDAETALRRSIALNPDNAYALNYLGYWLLEEGGDPEEALGFIRKAIDKQPQNGYFMDSLGWGYYRLGQYRQAVLYLEHAVVLEPQDPIITDHLGDAYAKMKRQREAVFQWERALAFSPEDELKDSIILKLNEGKMP